MMNKAEKDFQAIKAVIFDWSGTIIDFGSLAPVKVFLALFAAHGVSLTDAEIRAPMGMLKRDHIRMLLQMERVAQAWKEVHGALATEETVEALNEELERQMPAVAASLATPLPGVIAALQSLRQRGIRIGSTTGYTRETMDAVRPAASKLGVEVDALYTSSDVPAGRPSPWMIYRNCIDLDVYPPSSIVKIGDTVQDVYEGLNAGAWTVGVVVGSSLLGLAEEEVAALDTATCASRIEDVRETFLAAGAHYVIENMSELDSVITDIERRLNPDR
jgi:phosphonoacetaldehyde hydrolase